MNAPHEEAAEFAKQSKRENRVYVGNLSYDVKYRDLMEFMRGGGWEDLRSVFRLFHARGELVHGLGELGTDSLVPDAGDVAAEWVTSNTKSEVTASGSGIPEAEAMLREVRLRRDVWSGSWSWVRGQDQLEAGVIMERPVAHAPAPQPPTSSAEFHGFGGVTS